MKNPKEHHPSEGALFSRIMLQLTLPLFLLATLLTALQVNTQFRFINKLHLVQGQSTFSSIGEKFSEFPDIENEQDLKKFTRKVKSLQDIYNLSEIGLYDYLKRTPVLGEWEPFDLEQVEKSMLQKKEGGKSYMAAINKDTKQLIAYIPVVQPDSNNIFIIRAAIGLSDFKEAARQSRDYLIIMMVFILIVGSIIGINMSNSIVKPIRLLNLASGELIRGKLGKQVSVHTGDEIEVLANTFNHMSSSLEEMQKKAIDANPLTGLSGNQGIFKELKKRIFERQKFVLFHVDLDRFKVFNDHYGLAKGDEAIKNTAELLKRCVAEKGAHDDYLGHQGGDDFVVITRPQKAEALAQTICQRFDAEVVPSVYSKEDVERGFTLHLDRRFFTETGQERTVEFPLLAISLAGISTAKKDLADYFQCMNMAAEIKREVKKNVKSSYIIQENF